MHQIPDDHAIHHVFSPRLITSYLPWPPERFRRAGIGLIEAHDLSPRRLLQSELIVGQRFVEFQFEDVQRDVVTLARPFDLNGGGE